MKIFSIALSPHDQNTYDGMYHHQVERHSRKKHNIPWHYDAYAHHSEGQKMNQNDNRYMLKFYDEFWKPSEYEILAFTTTRGGMELLDNPDISEKFLEFKPDHLWSKMIIDNIYYIDHHQSHAAYAFLSSGFDKSDILAIDGRGWHYNCVFFDQDGNMTDLSDKMSIGILWNYFAKALGFGHLGAGKLMGLAGYGKYVFEVHDLIDYYSQNDFNFPKGHKNIFENYPPEDIAFTLQYATQELIDQYVLPLKSSDNICLAGGVAYNGYMNEEFTKTYKNVHVPPAVGDEGQSLGTYMHADFVLNKNIHIPNVYAGIEYDEITEGEPLDMDLIAEEIADGAIVGWFQGKSESGNRALGNRSILADPRNPDIKDVINKNIKFREDFRPFAPSVLEEYYQEFFDTNQPSPYMSRIMSVRSPEIPGVTHVDGTARIQTVNRKQNEKFYDMINAFYKVTGIPMLLNTSFNCQEPIVETPQQAIRTFKKTELDILVIGNRMIWK